MNKSSVHSESKIVKNSFFLTVRMVLIMLVSLYTSRVVLDKLGVENYGIYQSVGGIVMMFSFINAALSNGSSRFLSYALGLQNKQQLQDTFSTVFFINLILSIIICVIVEPIGMYLIKNKLVITEERLNASVITFHLAVITCFFQLMVIPFIASIISHERMKIYAYIGFIDVILKLGICYLLSTSLVDKLVLYSFLLLSAQILIFLIFSIFSYISFEEVNLRINLKKDILFKVCSYSFWSVFGSATSVFNNYGCNLILAMFFSPVIVAARSVANIANMAVNQFIGNIRTAVNPHVVKLFAKNDVEESKKVVLNSTRYTFYIVLIIILPLLAMSDYILHIWLKEVPEYTEEFFAIAISSVFFQVFDSSFYTALYANGKIKENVLSGPIVALLTLPVSYIFFYLGFSPLFLAWMLFFNYMYLGLIQKPILLIKIAGYRAKEIYSVIFNCLKVFVISVFLPVLVYVYHSYLVRDNFFLCLIMSLSIIILIFLSITIFGINKSEKNYLITQLLHFKIELKR